MDVGSPDSMTAIKPIPEISCETELLPKILDFSNAIASATDKNLLAKELKKQLRELFEISDYVVHALSGDRKTHRPILYDPDADFAQHPDFIKLIHSETDVNDGIFNRILAADAPVYFNAIDWFACKEPPVYASAAHAVGLTQMTGVAIRLGKQNIGVINFRQDESYRWVTREPLFKSICSQIAIIAAHAIASEKLDRQLAQMCLHAEESSGGYQYPEIIGNSPAMQKVLQLVGQVAKSDSTVLLLGETGTGKELIARAIHNASPRSSKAMVKVNCAAMPANLVESELFGHERGSFTGATERRVGKFEMANNGSLFLDEIGEMPLSLQVKLLRALQEREIERVGGSHTIKVNVRVIAATNRDLDKEIDEGRFRKDLYYRLNIYPIFIPPLRDRKEDIPSLAAYFINRYARKAGRTIYSLGHTVLKELQNYSWPGNIRELEHLIERSVLLTPGETIRSIDLPAAAPRHSASSAKEEVKLITIAENERAHILAVLKACQGRITGEKGAAKILGIPPTTLNSKMKRLQIRREHNA
jgi:formate hydrogenlyase transcriptional activator